MHGVRKPQRTDDLVQMLGQQQQLRQGGVDLRAADARWHALIRCPLPDEPAGCDQTSADRTSSRASRMCLETAAAFSSGHPSCRQQKGSPQLVQEVADKLHVNMMSSSDILATQMRPPIGQFRHVSSMCSECLPLSCSSAPSRHRGAAAPLSAPAPGTAEQNEIASDCRMCESEVWVRAISVYLQTLAQCHTLQVQAVAPRPRAPAQSALCAT